MKGHIPALIPLLLALVTPAAGAQVAGGGSPSPRPDPAADTRRAEGDAQLTPAAAAQAALEHFPGVAAADYLWQAARAEAQEAQARFRPTVGLATSVTQYQEPSLVTPIHGFDFTQLPEFDRTLLRGGLEARYTLYDGGGDRARARQLASRAEAAGESLAATRQLTVARVASAYLRVLSQAEALAAERARIEALEAERGRVLQRLEVGRAAEVERLRIEAGLAAARATETTRAMHLELAERELARLMATGADAARAHHLAPVAPPAGSLPPRPELRRQALAASPVVEEARRRLLAAEAGLALAESGRRPQVEAVAQELGFGSPQGDLTAEWNAGVQVSVPLYTGGATGRRIARARAAREAAAQSVRAAELDVERQLDETLATIEEAAASRRSLEAAVASFEEVVRIEELRLANDVGTQTDYLEARAQLLASQAGLAEARFRQAAGNTELARVLGRLSPEWLERNLTPRPPAATRSQGREAPPEERP